MNLKRAIEIASNVTDIPLTDITKIAKLFKPTRRGNNYANFIAGWIVGYYKAKQKE